jgi:hypothetical protein
MYVLRLKDNSLLLNYHSFGCYKMCQKNMGGKQFSKICLKPEMNFCHKVCCNRQYGRFLKLRTSMIFIKTLHSKH